MGFMTGATQTGVIDISDTPEQLPKQLLEQACIHMLTGIMHSHVQADALKWDA